MQELNKEKYRNFAVHQALPLQIQPFWLDVVTQKGTWDVCLSLNKEGNIIGVLPYYVEKKWGTSIIKMPPLTDYLGPYMTLGDQQTFIKRHSTYTKQQNILTDLIQQLPDAAFFAQQYDYHMDNWLPFLWAGFRQTSLYTFIIPKQQSEDEAYRNLRGNIRTNIKKAERCVTVEVSQDLDALITINETTFRQKKQRLPYQKVLLRQLDNVLVERNQRTIFLAKDKSTRELHAALYVVSDENTSYFLLSGIDRKYKSSAAMHLLYWKAIVQSLNEGKEVDFCGSILPGVEHLYRAFGARRTTHFLIYKTANKWLEMISLIRGMQYNGRL